MRASERMRRAVLKEESVIPQKSSSGAAERMRIAVSQPRELAQARTTPISAMNPSKRTELETSPSTIDTTALERERDMLLRRLEQTGVSDNSRIVELNKQIDAANAGNPTFFDRVAATEDSVRQSFFGAMKGVGAMALNTAKDVDLQAPTAVEQRRSLENAAAQYEFYAQKAAEAKTDAERKEWQMKADYSKRAQALLVEEREHPLDAPIESGLTGKLFVIV